MDFLLDVLDMFIFMIFIDIALYIILFFFCFFLSLAARLVRRTYHGNRNRMSGSRVSSTYVDEAE